MKVQVLGCVEVRKSAGSRISLPDGARRLLAGLSWAPNDFVADEQVIERVWERDTAQHPQQALYNVAARLRKALRCLGNAGDVELTRRRGGYILVVDEAAVDLSRFRMLAQQAKDAGRRGEDETALKLYGEALSLWRGEPFSEIKTPWADSVRATLRHERRDALGRSAELGLRSGRHEEYVPALHQLAAAHPWDEKVAALLMLALYRSGRQGEALRQFRLIRSTLVDVTGDEPGQELRDLHDQMLRRDPCLRDTTAWSAVTR
ncbi:BTAD domain-containing putative transcriptional regulator [Streptomyces sp. NPDC050988]|uniref:AfsR/SARP family transcriptional regulator n=1 Tax=Streptomyces sp. NPDC050988 TaxID=3365637 RepID=UPI00379B0523